jgi:molybdopterin-containing oxidoreductase family membrane subunit
MLAVLLAVTGMVFVAWFFQLAYGIGMAGKNRPSFWGLYITTFVFWIGISHAGTLISAILRVVQA